MVQAGAIRENSIPLVRTLIEGERKKGRVKKGGNDKLKRGYLISKGKQKKREKRVREEENGGSVKKKKSHVTS